MRFQTDQEVHTQKQIPNAQHRPTPGQHRTSGEIRQVKSDNTFYTRFKIRILKNPVG